MKNLAKILVEFFKRTWIAILAVAIVVVAGVSSVEIYKEEVLKIDPDVEVVEPDTLYLACSSLDSLNPVSSQSEDTYYLSKLIYNSLFDFDENMNVVPELVDEYEVNLQKAKVTLTLKPGITWHNGKKLTAKDVQFTVNAMNSAGKKCAYHEKTSKIMYVNVKGDRKLEIFFRNNHNCSLDDLTFPIVPASQYGSPSAFASATSGFRPIGTGQYQYQSYNYLKQLRLKPNEDYFGAVASKKIRVMVLPDEKLASNMMEINSVTCYVDTTAERKSTVIDKDLTMYDVMSNKVDFVVFNPNGKYTKSKKFRQAIAYAIDEQDVLDNAYMHDGTITDTIYYPNFLGVTDSGGSTYRYDAEHATNLLKELGYQDKDNDDQLRGRDGKPVKLRILVNRNDANRLTAARLIARSLEDQGFVIELKEFNWKNYQKAIKKKAFDLLLTGYQMEENYDLRSFFNGKNEWDYYNYKLFAQAAELEKLQRAEDYTAIYAHLRDLLLDELPYYPLCYKNIGLVGVKGFVADEVPMFNDFYKNIETWYWTYEVIHEQAETKGEADKKEA